MSHHIAANLAGAVLGLASIVAHAATYTFFDGTFSLSDYTIATQQSPGGGVSFTQSLSDGNPGAAFVGTYSTPSTDLSTYFNRSRVLNSTFTYNPITQGSLRSVSWTLDSFFGTSGTLGRNGANILIFQDGNFYINGVALASIPNVYLTASKSEAVSTDFSLITDPLTFATDPSRHPDFGGDVMTFGFVSSVSVLPGAPSGSISRRFDNFGILLSPVPELPMYVYGIVALLLVVIRQERLRASAA